MNKETLHIFYDNGIKAELKSIEGQYLSESAWKEMLSSLMNEKKFQRKCSADGLTVEYDSMIVVIDNWKQLNSSLLKEYIKKVVVNQQANRVNRIEVLNDKLTEKNDIPSKESTKNVLNPDDDSDEILPAHISKVLKERQAQRWEQEKQEAYNRRLLEQEKRLKQAKHLKVKRKNKYKFIISIITGTFVMTSFSYCMFHADSNDLTDDESDLSKNKESITMETEISPFSNNSQEDSFEIGLDINEVAPMVNDAYTSDSKLSYEDYSQETKAIETKMKYGELIEKNAQKCGIDPQIILGIATQESGDHEYGLRQGSKGGLMQVEMSYWRGKEVTYYDFDDKQHYVLMITDENIEDVDNNILIGCAIFQNELKTFNYNILLAIQSYNMGYSSTSKILDATSANIGMTKTQIINDNNCLDWLNYTSVPGVGDPDYVNHVLSWIGYGYHFYELYCKDENGNVKTCTTLPMESTKAKAT